jgi:hypothetical protein
MMESTIIQKIGLGSFDIGYLLIGFTVMLIVLLILVIIIMKRLSKLNSKYQKFMQGKVAKSLESDIIALYEDNKYVKKAVEKNHKEITLLNDQIATTFQKVGLVKYDAFSHMGGKLSYSIALLDEKNNGFILNSVHSAEGCYSYTKEVVAGESAIILGEEERQALNIAMNKFSNEH